MTHSNSNPPNLITLVRKAVITGAGALHNRSELFLMELREEKSRVIELLIWTAISIFLGAMFIMVLTAAVILLFPSNLRVYAAGGFCFFYLLAAILALVNLKALLKGEASPFPDTVAELKKDREWLESLK